MFAATGSTITAAISSAMRIEKAFDRGEIVVRRVERQRGERLRHAGRRGDAKRGEARARLGKKAVAVAVIAALEFDDQVAAGGRARQAHRAHGRFGARADEAHALAATAAPCGCVVASSTSSSVVMP